MAIVILYNSHKIIFTYMHAYIFPLFIYCKGLFIKVLRKSNPDFASSITTSRSISWHYYILFHHVIPFIPCTHSEHFLCAFYASQLTYWMAWPSISPHYHTYSSYPSASHNNFTSCIVILDSVLSHLSLCISKSIPNCMTNLSPHCYIIKIWLLFLR